MTRGFMSETKSARRSVKHGRERNWGRETAIVVVFMANCSGLKEVDFREINEFVAAATHDFLLVER
jgi:hypothetical protein